MTDREKVKAYIPMVKFIAAVCGPRCEVVLHCLDDLDHSIVYIENGYISGRRVGDGLIDFALSTVYDEEYTKNDFTVNFRGQSLEDNRTMRFSAYYIKNEKGKVIGFLGVNVDVSELEHFRDVLNAELFFRKGPVSEESDQTHHAISASRMLDSAFDEALESIHCSKISELTKEDKMKVISILNNRNLFALKGVVSRTARKLSISEATVYRYLRELKNKI